MQGESLLLWRVTVPGTISWLWWIQQSACQRQCEHCGICQSCLRGCIGNLYRHARECNQPNVSVDEERRGPSGQTAATYSDSTLANSDTIRCVMNGTVTSNALVMTVNTATASITASGVTTFCADNSVTLTASAGASYQWSNNEIFFWVMQDPMTSHRRLL